MQMLDFAISCFTYGVVPTITIRLPKELIEWLKLRKVHTGIPIQKTVEQALIQFRAPIRSAAGGGTKRRNTNAAAVPSCADQESPDTL